MAEFSSFFRSALLLHAPLPIAIAPGETHSLVVRVAPQQLAKLGDTAAPGGHFSTLLTLAYAVAGRSLVVPHTLSWSCHTPRAQAGFLLSFKAAAVAPGSATLSARLVVHNGFDEARDLNLLVGPVAPPAVACASDASGAAARATAAAPPPPPPPPPPLPRGTAGSSQGSHRHGGEEVVPSGGATASLLRLSRVHREEVAEWATECGQVPGLQAAVRLGCIEGHASTSVSVGFLPLRRGRVEINSIFLHDRTNDLFFRMSEPFEVLAG